MNRHPCTRATGRALPALALAFALAFAAPLAAQPAAAPVLQPGQITESALLDALALDVPAADVGPTRGFRPAVRTATAVAAGTPAPQARAGRANLLITFESASAALAPETMAALDKVAAALQHDRLAGFSFRVEGHADARGDAQFNLLLSEQRAQAVVDYLVRQHGILPERLRAHGKGSAEPLNTERVDAPENRRVTVVTDRG